MFLLCRMPPRGTFPDKMCQKSCWDKSECNTIKGMVVKEAVSTSTVSFILKYQVKL